MILRHPPDPHQSCAETSQRRDLGIRWAAGGRTTLSNRSQPRSQEACNFPDALRSRIHVIEIPGDVMPASVTAAIVWTVSVGILMLGTAPAANAGLVGTSEYLATQARQTEVDAVTALLQREDVRDRLLDYGVESERLTERLAGLTTAEIAELHAGIEEHVAGGDVLALAGAVFVVLLILEVVGVTDVFSGL
jgi:hypothetical protein